MNPAEELEALTAPGGPYEMTMLDTGRGEVPVFVRAPGTLGELYEQALSTATFLVEDAVRLTYAQAHERAAAIARMLVDEHGIVPGDRVAISMRNHAEWMHTFAAVTSVGAIAVAMNSLWTSEEMAFALIDSEPKVLVADQERIERALASGATNGTALWGVRLDPERSFPASVRSMDDVLRHAAGTTMPAATVGPDDPATILYTSGSTGNPKGVLSTHRNIISALFTWELESKRQSLRALIAAGTGAEPAPAPTPVALLAVPLFHVLGLHSVYLSSYRSQRALVVMNKWDPVVAAELIERERVTSFSGPPTMTGDLVRVAETSGRDLTSLMTVGGGGAARAPEQVERINTSFRSAAPSTGWGMTETSAAGTTISGADYLDRPTSAGRALAVVSVRVVDETGSVLPSGDVGELQVRGTVVFREYWRRPDATAEVFTPDGWFRTGDVARIDAEGYVYIVDRIKDLIIRGGENIGCGHVEAALLTHPDVLEAAVYAVPDERLGEEVGATIHALNDVDLDGLLSHVRGHLAAHEVPRHLRVSRDPLPRTGSGKMFKRQMRDEMVAFLASQNSRQSSGFIPRSSS